MRLRFLRTKLTLVFGGLFCLVLLIAALVVFLSVRGSVLEQVRNEFQATATVQEKLLDLQRDQLAENARIASRDFGFRAAVATLDKPTIDSALANLRGRLGIQLAAVIGNDGQTIGWPVSGDHHIEPDMLRLLQADERRSGILALDGLAYVAVAEPVLAPDRLGWVVFGTAINRSMLADLESLSPIDLEAQILPPGASLSGGRDQVIAVSPLPSFESGTDSYKLALSYPLAKGMAPYNAMFSFLALAAAGGLLLLVLGAALISRSLTRPISALDLAAQKLGRGETVELTPTGQDEISRLTHRFADMAGKVQRREVEIRQMSLTDIETGLPNRRALIAEIERNKHAGGTWSIVAFGIDRFDQIRDVVGEQACNHILRQIGLGIREQQGVVAIGRLTTSTVAALFGGIDADHLVSALEARNLNKTRRLAIEGQTVDIQLSAGLAGPDVPSPIDVLDTAMAALRQARALRRSAMVFDPVVYGDPSGTLSMMGDLLADLERGLIDVHYQAKLNLKRGVIDSAEALVRWTSPERGMVRPDQFISIAEETGHIVPLTEYVVARTLEAGNNLRKAGFDIKLAVNLSGRLVTDPEFVAWLLQLDRGEIVLRFEITETAVINDLDLALGNIRRLRAAGYETSIDDYGTGLSSLSYVQQIPADELKIDRAFIDDLGPNSGNAIMVRSTIELAHRLGMEATCEGVEDRATLDLLRVMGADHAQGYFVAKPMPADAFEAFLKQGMAPAITSRKLA